MADSGNIAKLREARNAIARVYEDEVKDTIYDNGNLDNLNSAIKFVEMAIKELNKREQE